MADETCLNIKFNTDDALKQIKDFVVKASQLALGTSIKEARKVRDTEIQQARIQFAEKISQEKQLANLSIQNIKSKYVLEINNEKALYFERIKNIKDEISQELKATREAYNLNRNKEKELFLEKINNLNEEKKQALANNLDVIKKIQQGYQEAYNKRLLLADEEKQKRLKDLLEETETRKKVAQEVFNNRLRLLEKEKELNKNNSLFDERKNAEQYRKIKELADRKNKEIQDGYNKELNNINQLHNRLIENAKQEREINLKETNNLYNERLRKINDTYNHEFSKSVELYNDRTSKLRSEFTEARKNIDLKYQLDVNEENKKHKLAIGNIRERLQLELNNIRNIRDENINNLKKLKNLSIENIRSQFNDFKNSLSKDSFNPINLAFNDLKNRLTGIYNDVTSTFTRINSFIVTNTQKALKEAFGDFNVSDKYIRSIQSMRELEGTAKDLLAGKKESFLPYDTISSDIIDIANKYGKKISEVSHATQKAIESGLGYNEALKVVDSSIMGSIASHSDLYDIMNGLLKTIYSYGDATKGYSDSVQQADKFLNMFLIASTRSSLSLGDFAKTLGSVVPQARLLGVELPEVISMLSVLGQKTKNYSEAGVALINLFNKLRNPIKETGKILEEVNKALAKLNKSPIKLGEIGIEKEGGAVQLLMKISEVTKMLNRQEAEYFRNRLFNELRASKGFSAIKEALTILGDETKLLTKDTNYLNTAYDNMVKTVEYRIESMKNKIINSFETIYFNNRNVINSIITEVGNYIEKGINYILNFIKRVISSPELLSMFLNTIKNIEQGFIITWKALVVLMGAFNKVFGKGGITDNFTGDIGVTFLQMLNTISNLVVTGANLFLAYSKAVFGVSQAIGVVTRFIVSFIQGLSNLNSVVQALIYSLGFHGLLGVFLGLTNPITTIISVVLGAISALLSHMSGLNNVLNSINNTMLQIDSMRVKSETQANSQKLYNEKIKEEERILKRIADLEQKRASIKNKKGSIGYLADENPKEDVEYQLELEKKNLAEVRKQIERQKIGAEKGNVSLFDYRAPKLTKIEDVNKLIPADWKNFIKKEVGTGELSNLDLTPSKEKQVMNKQVSNLRSRLNEIEDIYKTYLNNTETLFNEGAINIEQKMNKLKVAEIFKVDALELLKSGQEFQKGYNYFINTLDELNKAGKINKDSLIPSLSELRDKISIVNISNAKELQIISKQQEEIKNRQSNAIKKFSQHKADYEFDLIKKQINDLENNLDVLQKLSVLSNTPEAFKGAMLNTIKELEQKKQELDKTIFGANAQKVEEEKKQILEKQQKYNSMLLKEQIDNNKKLEEKELINLKNRFDLGLLSENEYNKKVLRTRINYLKERERLNKSYFNREKQQDNALLSDLVENQKHNIADLEEIEKQKEQDNINRQIRIRNYIIEANKKLLDEDRITSNKRKEIFDNLLKDNVNNIDETISVIEQFAKHETDIIKNFYSGVSEVVDDFLGIFKNIFIRENTLPNIVQGQENSFQLISNISNQLLNNYREQIKLQNQLNLLEIERSKILDNNSEEAIKLDKQISNIKSMLEGLSIDPITIVIVLSKMAIDNIKSDIDNLAKYGVKSFDDFVISIENFIISTFGVIPEAIANLFGTSLKSKLSGHIKEIIDGFTSDLKRVSDEWNKYLEDLWEKGKKLIENLTNKDNEIRDFKIESYKKEKQLIDDIFKTQINNSRERIKQIKKEKQEELDSIRAVRDLKNQREVSQARKQTAIKSLKEQLGNQKYSEDFYRQTLEEFNLNIKDEEEKIKQEYEVLGTIDFKEFQGRMRQLAVKKASYYQRRLSGAEEPEIKKLADEEERLLREQKGLENAKLIAKLNKDKLKEAELDKQIELTKQQLMNVQQLKDGNSLLKFRSNMMKEYQEAQKQYLDNYYDTEMEAAEAQDRQHKKNIEALDIALKTEERNLKTLEKAYDMHINELFRAYNSGSDEWYKGMEQRQRNLINSAKAIFDNFNLTANTELSKVLADNNLIVRGAETATEKLKTYFSTIADSTANIKQDIADIISKLNEGVKTIQNPKTSGTSLIQSYSQDVTSKAISLSTERHNIANELKTYHSQNSNIIKQVANVPKEQAEAERFAKIKSDIGWDVLGNNEDKKRAIVADYLINNYNFKPNEAISHSKKFNVSSINNTNDLYKSVDVFVKLMKPIELLGLTSKKYATGGVIDRPTLALMGEAGAETVFNARQMRNLYNMINTGSSNNTSNSITITINNPVVRNDTDINKIANIVTEKISKQLIRQI